MTGTVVGVAGSGVVSSCLTSGAVAVVDVVVAAVVADCNCGDGTATSRFSRQTMH